MDRKFIPLENTPRLGLLRRSNFGYEGLTAGLYHILRIPLEILSLTGRTRGLISRVSPVRDNSLNGVSSLTGFIDTLKSFKTVYLHIHGIGDLIISMPYIRWVMARYPSFALCVRDSVYRSGFFNKFLFKERVFPGCPPLWNSTQTYSSFKAINTLCRELGKRGVNCFYIRFNKFENRRMQVCKGLSQHLREEIPFQDKIHGEVYLDRSILDQAKKKAEDNVCFLHTRSASSLKSVVPSSILRYVDTGKFSLFCPPLLGDINYNFAVQLVSKKIVVVDSVYMHSAAALGRNIDILFVAASVKKFFHTLAPSNIKIYKIIYGNLWEALKSFVYYEIFIRKSGYLPVDRNNPIEKNEY